MQTSGRTKRWARCWFKIKTKDFISRKQKNIIKDPFAPTDIYFKKCEGVVEQSTTHAGPEAPGNLNQPRDSRCGLPERACQRAGVSRNRPPPTPSPRAPGQFCHPVTGRQFGRRSEKWVRWPHIPRRGGHSNHNTSGLLRLPPIILPALPNCKLFRTPSLCPQGN